MNQELSLIESSKCEDKEDFKNNEEIKKDEDASKEENTKISIQEHIEIKNSKELKRNEDICEENDIAVMPTQIIVKQFLQYSQSILTNSSGSKSGESKCEKEENCNISLNFESPFLGFEAEDHINNENKTSVSSCNLNVLTKKNLKKFMKLKIKLKRINLDSYRVSGNVFKSYKIKSKGSEKVYHKVEVKKVSEITANRKTNDNESTGKSSKKECIIENSTSDKSKNLRKNSEILTSKPNFEKCRNKLDSVTSMIKNVQENKSSNSAAIQQIKNFGDKDIKKILNEEKKLSEFVAVQQIMNELGSKDKIEINQVQEDKTSVSVEKQTIKKDLGCKDKMQTIINNICKVSLLKLDSNTISCSLALGERKINTTNDNDKRDNIHDTKQTSTSKSHIGIKIESLSKSQINPNVLKNSSVTSSKNSKPEDKIKKTSKNEDESGKTLINFDKISKSSRFEDQIGKNSKTEEQIGKSSKTEEQIGKSSKTENQIRKTSKTEEQIGKSSKTENHIRKNSKTEDQIGKSSKTENQIGTMSKSDDKIGKSLKTDDKIGKMSKPDDKSKSLKTKDNSTEILKTESQITIKFETSVNKIMDNRIEKSSVLKSSEGVKSPLASSSKDTKVHSISDKSPKSSKHSVIEKNSSSSKSSAIKTKMKAIPGLSYIIASKNSTKDKGQGFTYDCVLCMPHQPILMTGSTMKSHLRTREHLLNVLEIDNYEMYKLYKNNNTMNSSELFQKVCNCDTITNNKIVASSETYEEKRQVLIKLILKLRKTNSKEMGGSSSSIDHSTKNEKRKEVEERKKEDLIKSDKLMEHISSKMTKTESSNFDSLSKNHEKTLSPSLKIMESSLITNYQSFTEKLVLKQKDRSPKQIVFVLDNMDSYIQTDAYADSIKILRSKKLNFDSLLQSPKFHDILGKDSFIIILLGIYDLVRATTLAICKRMKCPNQLMKYSVISTISSDYLISKALRLHEYILDHTSNDQVMFCELVPIDLSDNIVRRCGNKHTLKDSVSNDIRDQYLMTLKKYNEFVACHTRMIGFKSWNLLSSLFPNRYKHNGGNYSRDSTNSHIDDNCILRNILRNRTVLLEQTCPNQEQLINSSDNVVIDTSSKNQPLKETPTNSASKISYCEMRSFDKIVIMTNRSYLWHMEKFRGPQVEIVVSDLSNCNLTSTIEKLQNSQPRKTLWLSPTGIFTIARTTCSDLCLKSNPSCTRLLCRILPDDYVINGSSNILEDVRKTSLSIIEEVNSILNEDSAYLILPPIPPSFMIMETDKHRLYHEIANEQELYYFATSSDMDRLDIYTNLSRELISVIYSEASKMNLPRESLKIYELFTRRWSYHSKILTYDIFIQDRTAMSSKFMEWLSSMKCFVSTCLQTNVCTRGFVGPKSTVSDIFSTLSMDNDNPEWFDHIIVIGCPEHLKFIPSNIKKSKNISLISIKYKEEEWIEKWELDYFRSINNVLLIYIPSIKILGSECYVPLCTKIGCQDPISYLDLDSINELIDKKLKRVGFFLFGLLKHFTKGSKLIVTPLLPSKCCLNAMNICIDESNHKAVHQTLTKTDHPYILREGKEKWFAAATELNEVWISLVKYTDDKFQNIIEKNLKNSPVIRWQSLNKFCTNAAPEILQRNKSFIKNWIETAYSLINPEFKETTSEVAEEASSSVNRTVKSKADTSKRSEFKKFAKVMIITNNYYAHYVNDFRMPHVEVLVNEMDTLDGVVNTIKENSKFHPSNTLWLLSTGLFCIAKTDYCSMCRNATPFCIDPILIATPDDSVVKAADFAENICSNHLMVIRKVTSFLNSKSSFLVLPPIPPTFMEIEDRNHFKYHEIGGKELRYYYMSTSADIERFNFYLSKVNREMTRLTLAECRKMNISDEYFSIYEEIISKWKYHVKMIKFEDYSRSAKIIYKYHEWCKYLNMFIDSCVKRLDSPMSDISYDSVKDLSTDKINVISDHSLNNSKTRDLDTNWETRKHDTKLKTTPETRSFDNTSKPNEICDHLVLLCCDDQDRNIEVNSEDLSHVSIFNMQNLDWCNLKYNLDRNISLRSCKNILFVIVGDIKFLANEESETSCFHLNCIDPLTIWSLKTCHNFVDSESGFIKKKMNTILNLIHDIEVQFLERSKVILAPLFPSKCTLKRSISRNKHEHDHFHQSFANSGCSYLFHGNKANWDELIEKFNTSWRKEMFLRLRDMDSKVKDVLHEILSKMMPLLYWHDLRSDCKNVQNDFIEVKTFFKNLISLAPPSTLPCHKSEDNFVDVRQEKDVIPENDISKFQGQSDFVPEEHYSLAKERATFSEHNIPTLVLGKGDVHKINDNTFNYAYLITAEDLRSMTFCRNFEHIYHELSDVPESHLSSIVNKLGNIRPNSLCILAFNFLIFTKTMPVSPCCKIFKCPRSIPVINIDMDNSDNVNIISTNVMTKIMEFISFATKLSIHLPVIILPLFPKMIYCDDGTDLDTHKRSHFFTNTDTYIVYGRREKWEVFTNIVRDLWVNFTKSHYEKYFITEKLTNFITHKYKFLIYQDDEGNQSLSPDFNKWNCVLQIFLDILVTKNNEKKGEFSNEFLKQYDDHQTELINVILWNFSQNERRIFYNFKKMDSGSQVHRCDDHVRIEVPKRSLDKVPETLAKCKSFDSQLNGCILEDEDTPQMLCQRDWKDLVTFGSENSLKFIVGAAKVLAKQPPWKKAKVFLISWSVKFLNMIKSILLNFIQDSNIRIVVLGENSINSDSFDILLGIPSTIVDFHWHLPDLTSVEYLFIHDVTTLVRNDGDKALLLTIFRKLKINHNSAIKKVFVSKFYHSETVDHLSTLFGIPLKEVIKTDLSKTLRHASNNDEIKICSESKSSRSYNRSAEYLASPDRKRTRSRSKSPKTSEPSTSRSRSKRSRSKSRKELSYTSSRNKRSRSRSHRKKSKSPIRYEKKWKGDDKQSSLEDEMNINIKISNDKRTDPLISQKGVTDIYWETYPKSKYQSPSHFNRSGTSSEMLGNSRYKEFIAEKEKLSAVHKGEFDVYLSVPDLHYNYESFYEEFCLGYEKKYGKNREEEHKENHWNEFWKNKIELLKKEDWKVKVEELLSSYKLKVNVPRPQNKIVISKSETEDARNSYPSSSSIETVNSNRSHSSKVVYSSSKFEKISSINFGDAHSSKTHSPSTVIPSRSYPKRHSSFHADSSKSSRTTIDATAPMASVSSTSKSSAEISELRSGKYIDEKFSVDETLLLLEQVSHKLGMLGPAIMALSKSAKELGNDVNQILGLFRVEENLIIIKMAIDKIKKLQLTASSSSDVRFLSNTITQIRYLLDFAQNTPSNVNLDVKSLAIASNNKGSSFTLNIIKSAFANQGKYNPTKSEINEIYLQICKLHFDMSLEST